MASKFINEFVRKLANCIFAWNHEFYFLKNDDLVFVSECSFVRSGGRVGRLRTVANNSSCGGLGHGGSSGCPFPKAQSSVRQFHSMSICPREVSLQFHDGGRGWVGLT